MIILFYIVYATVYCNNFIVYHMLFMVPVFIVDCTEDCVDPSQGQEAKVLGSHCAVTV